VRWYPRSDSASTALAQVLPEKWLAVQSFTHRRKSAGSVVLSIVGTWAIVDVGGGIWVHFV
jgi:hypothetical protein